MTGRVALLLLLFLTFACSSAVAAQSDGEATPSATPTRVQPTPTVTLSPVFTEGAPELSLTTSPDDSSAVVETSATPASPSVEVTGTPLSAESLQATATFIDQTFDAYFEASTQAPQTGEPFTLTLNLSAPADYELTLPNFESTWSGGFTVLRVGDLETLSASEGMSTLYTVELDVVAWGLGQYSTPLTRVGVSNGDVDALVTVEPLFLSIPTVVGDERELRISRVLMELFYVPMWAVFGMVMVGVGGGVGVVRMLRRRASRRGDRVAAKVQRTIGGRTIQGLYRLHQTAPDWIARYRSLGDIMRVYLAERFGVPQDLTTLEALTLLQSRDEPLADVDMLAYLLNQADLAKFAPGSVLNPNDKPLVELAVEWVRATEKLLRSQG